MSVLAALKAIVKSRLILRGCELSDDVDVANQNTDEAIARTLANRVRNVVTVRPIDCAECGDPIEQKRRELIAGTEHCAECAAYFAERNRLLNPR